MAPPAKTLISAACTLVCHNRMVANASVDATTLPESFFTMPSIAVAVSEPSIHLELPSRCARFFVRSKTAARRPGRNRPDVGLWPMLLKKSLVLIDES
jgi:hypothetical protein